MAIEHHNEFSPKQEAWLAALESGKFRQGAGALFSKGRYCCLGVLAVVFGVPGLEMDNEVYCPSGVAEKAHLHSARGQLLYNDKTVTLKDIPNIQKMSDKFKDIDGLDGMNDSPYWTFKEIAAFIRARPWLVFKNFDAPEHFE